MASDSQPSVTGDPKKSIEYIISALQRLLETGRYLKKQNKHFFNASLIKYTSGEISKRRPSMNHICKKTELSI